jgi:MFS family permease
MAAGPTLGALVLDAVHFDPGVDPAGAGPGAFAGMIAHLAGVLGPAWRWVFYVNVPIGLVALFIGWAASYDWDTERRSGPVDIVGGLLFSLALTAGLVAITLLGTGSTDLGLSPQTVIGGLTVVAVAATGITIAWGIRQSDPYLDPRLFRNSVFSSAAIVSLLTGYAFATAIIGGAVFVDRVLYGGPDLQRLALGALALATALGALASGFAVRVMSLRVVTLVGLALSGVALVAMSRWSAATTIQEVALVLGAFGLGFGLTVTPRSTAALDAVGRRAYGVASATVTVARMIGMAIGLAVLTAYGSTTIERLYDQVYATPDAYKQFIPVELRDRSLRDGLVVEALESWAANEATRIMVGIFVVAAGVLVVAVPPALALGPRAGMLRVAEPGAAAGGSPELEGPDDVRSSVAL